MLHLILGSSPSARIAAAARLARSHHAHIVTLDATAWPFSGTPRATGDREPADGRTLWLVDEAHLSFRSAQTGGTRLVLTQSTYLVQALLDRVASDDLVVLAADEADLRREAPEAFDGRGPWRLAMRTDATPPDGHVALSPAATPPPWASALAEAFATASPTARVNACRDACADLPREAVAHLALASALRETGGPSDDARTAIEHATTLAPEWAAAWYEAGKLWLSLEDLPRAADAFARTATLMPRFSAAHSNLGAVLGELDQPEAALVAFERAQLDDPNGHTIINNMAVVLRELGRLDEAIEAHRRVIALAPTFVFGHYNLGHTLLLAGRFDESVAAYESGQALDATTNRRQACRLAMARFAAGDLRGAHRELWQAANQAEGDERTDLLLEACEIGQAVLPAHRAPAAAAAFLDEVATALA